MTITEVSLDAAKVYLITVKGKGEDPSLTLRHPKIEAVYDSEGHYIPYTASLGGGRGDNYSQSAELLFDPQHSSGNADYFIAVTGYLAYGDELCSGVSGTYNVAGGMGTYDLTVRSKVESDGYDWTFGMSTDFGTREALVVGGDYVEGRIDFTNDVDYFSFPVTAGSRYTVTIKPRGGYGQLKPAVIGMYPTEPPPQGDSDLYHETDLLFLRVDRTRLEYSSKSGGIWTFRFTAEDTAEYFFGVTGNNPFYLPDSWAKWRGPYGVKVEGPSGGPMLRADDCESDKDTACSITSSAPKGKSAEDFGGSNVGEIENEGDSDWFRVDLAASTPYRIDVKGASVADGGGSLPDPFVTLLDKDGNGLASAVSDDNSGEDNNARIASFTASSADTFYIEVKDATGTNTGTYTVEIVTSVDCLQNTSTECSLESNVPKSTAPEFVGGSRTGMLGVSGDNDWFEVHLDSDKTYQIDLKGDNTDDPGGTLPDPFVRVLNGSGMDLSPAVTDDDGGNGNNARIESFSPSTSGTHYIAVRSSDSTGTGTYTLEIFTRLDCPSDKDTHCSVQVKGEGYANATVDDNSEGLRSPTDSDVDWFALDLEVGESYTAYLSSREGGNNKLKDPMIVGLYDVSGNAVRGFDDQDGGYNEESAVELNLKGSGADERFYIAVGSENGKPGDYTLWVTRQQLVESTVEPEGEDLPANFATRGTVIPGDPATGAINWPGDIDAWALAVEGGQIYRLDVKGDCAEDYGGTLPDPADGSSSTDDRGECGNVRGTFMPSEDGLEYRLVASQECTPHNVIRVYAEGQNPGSNAFGFTYSTELDCSNPSNSGVGTYTVSLSDISGELSLSEPEIRCCNELGGMSIPGDLDEQLDAGGDWPQDDSSEAQLTNQDGDWLDDVGLELGVIENRSLMSEISQAGDRDWFKLDLRPYVGPNAIEIVSLQSGFDISVMGDSAIWDWGTLEDPFVTLYDSDGGVVTSDDNSGDGNDSLIRLRAEDIEREVFWVEVKSKDDVSTGTYMVRLSTLGGIRYTVSTEGTLGGIGVSHTGRISPNNPAPFPDVPTNTETRGRVLAGKSVKGVIDENGDADSYRVYLERGKSYQIDAKGESATDDGGSLADLIVTLFDGQGNALAQDDNSGDHNNARIESYSPNKSAQYYLVVSDPDDVGTGTYTLEVLDKAGLGGGSDSNIRTACSPAGTSQTEVSFSNSSYTVNEGDSIAVTVILSQAAVQTVIVPIRVERRGGALAADYSGIPESLKFNAGEASKSFQFWATDDTENDNDELVWLSLCTLPDGISAGNTREAQIAIVDDDIPGDLEVGFGIYRVSIDEGSSAEFAVFLSQVPERQVEISLAATGQDGATAQDYTISPLILTFGPNEIVKTFEVAVSEDSENDDGESILLSFGTLPAGISHSNFFFNSEATVEMGDTDFPALSVEFQSASYSVLEGESLNVEVTLDVKPQRAVSIPITVATQGGAGSGDYSTATAVAFKASERRQIIQFSAIADQIDDDGESVLLGFGVLPEGVSAAGTATATVTIVNDDFPGNSSTTGAVAVGGTATGSIDADGDADWFSVTLETGKSYRLDVMGESATEDGGTLSDPFLKLYDASGNAFSPPVKDDNTGVDNNARKVYWPGLTGTYYIEVTDPDGSGTGTYTVAVTQSNDDFSEDASTTGTVAVGSQATGNINFDGDADWFSVTLESKKWYQIDVKGESDTDDGGTLPDPFTMIYDRFGFGLLPQAKDDNAGADNNAKLYFRPEMGEIYYIEVREFDGSGTGTYTVLVTLVDDYAGGTSTTGAVEVGSQTTGEINIDGDADWFSVELKANMPYLIDVKGVSDTDSGGTLDDAFLNVYDKNGDAMSPPVQDDNAGADNNARMIFWPHTADTYYIEARDPDDSGTGTYTVAVALTTDDYSGTTSTTGIVAVDGEAEGNINATGDRDWFRVTLEKGIWYRLDVKGESATDDGGSLPDPFLELYKGNGNGLSPAVQDDNTGADNNAQELFRPTAAGDYFIEVREPDNSGVGTYTVSVTKVDDYSDTISTTASITLGVDSTGNIFPDGDKDWFRVALEAGEWYQFHAKSATGGGELADPFLRVYDSDGDALPGPVEDDNNGTGNNAHTLYGVDTTDVYYVEVKDPDGSGTGAYLVAVSLAEDDFDDGISTTGAVPAPGQTTGEIQFPTDRDWFRVTLGAAKWYTAEVRGYNAGNPGGTLGLPCIEMFDANGDPLNPDVKSCDYNDASASNNTTDVTFQVPATGLYFIEARSSGSSNEGTYTVIVRELDPEGESTATTSTVAVGGMTTGAVEIFGDVDWFRVTLDAGQWYRVDVESSTDGGVGGRPLDNPVLAIYDSNGDPMSPPVEDDDSGVGNNAQVIFQVGTAGTYYVAVKDFAEVGGKGGYTVSLTAVVDDFSADTSTVGAITVDSEVEGRIDMPGDVDWILVELMAGKEYSIAVRGDSQSDSGGTLTDPFVRLYDSSGSALSPAVEDDNSGVPPNARVAFTPATEDTYYIEVTDASGTDTGTYTVSVALPEDDFAGDTTTIGTVDVDGKATGVIDTDGDTDWFEVTLASDTWYRFDARGASISDSGGTLYDPFVKLYDDSGNAMSPSVEDDNSGEENNARAFYSPATAGAYFVEAATSDGTGTGEYTVTVATVALDTTVVAVAAGWQHTCAILNSGDADNYTECWGENGRRQARPPTNVSLAQISAGEEHNCGVDGEGAVHCWGRGAHGRTEPPDTSDFVSAHAGGRHSCGLKTDGAVECWGDNRRDQATPPSNLTEASYISTGLEDTCAVKAEADSVGQAECWGRNKNNRHDPVNSSHRYHAIEDGFDHGCGIRSDDDRRLSCWGKDYNNTMVPTNSVRFSAIQSGFEESCGIKADGEVRCLRTGKPTDESGPHPEVSDSPTGTYKAISYNYKHACAITTLDKLLCWGGNTDDDDVVNDKINTPLDLRYQTLVRFRPGSYTVAEGASVTVTLDLIGESDSPLTVPITVTPQNGATSADYTIVSSVVFAEGDTSKTLDFSAATDGLSDAGESVLLGFGTLPAGTGLASPAETVIFITEVAETLKSENPVDPEDGVTDNDGKDGTEGESEGWEQDAAEGIRIPGDPDATGYNGESAAGTVNALLKPRDEGGGSVSTDLKVDWTHANCTGEEDWFSVSLTARGLYHLTWVKGDPALYREISSSIIGYDPVPGQTEYTTGWAELNRQYEDVRQSELDLAVRVECNKSNGGELVGLVHLEDPGTALEEETGETSPEGEPLKADFENVPSSHDGSSAFTLRMAFTDDVEITPEDMRDHALLVTGGTVTAAVRVDDRKDLWELTIQPSENGAVSILTPLDRACTEVGALCTADGRTLTVASALQVAGPPPQVNSPATGAPAITGTAQVGETLTADTSGIADTDGLDNVSFSYQWVANDGTSDSDISGGTDSTYTLVAADEGRTVKVKVAFTDDAGNEESLTSATTGTVAAAPSPNNSATGAPAITGTAQVGETLTADTSGIADADGLTNVSYSYQWIRHYGGTDTNISGATDSSYTLVNADEGGTIRVRVSFTDDADNGETLTSPATAAVDAAPNSPATGAPAIAGTAQVGETLTADTSGIGDSDGLTNASYSYQWVRNDSTTDTDITGATASTYTLADDDEGKTIRVRVSFTDDADNDESLTSAATAAVGAASNSPATGAPGASPARPR